jgi:hypothetical protein
MWGIFRVKSPRLYLSASRLGCGADGLRECWEVGGERWKQGESQGGALPRQRKRKTQPLCSNKKSPQKIGRSVGGRSSVLFSFFERNFSSAPCPPRAGYRLAMWGQIPALCAEKVVAQTSKKRFHAKKS